VARASRPRLLDMQEHIAFLKGIATEHSFAQFAESIALQYACQYAILVIAEAANHLPQALRDRAPDVPWRSIISIGNKLRHEYYGVDKDVIWDTMANHLDRLDDVVKLLLIDADAL
jgi:uncharacterized protein with HEPN domain